MPFLSYCGECQESVTAFPVLDGVELQQKLSTDAEIEVMHVSDVGGHKWMLSKHEKEHLRNYLTRRSAASA